MVAMGVTMLKYSYQCADSVLNLNANQGVITAKLFQNTINKWSAMVNLHVPKKCFLKKYLYVSMSEYKTTLSRLNRLQSYPISSCTGKVGGEKQTILAGLGTMSVR